MGLAVHWPILMDPDVRRDRPWDQWNRCLTVQGGGGRNARSNPFLRIGSRQFQPLRRRGEFDFRHAGNARGADHDCGNGTKRPPDARGP